MKQILRGVGKRWFIFIDIFKIIEEIFFISSVSLYGCYSYKSVSFKCFYQYKIKWFKLRHTGLA